MRRQHAAPPRNQYQRRCTHATPVADGNDFDLRVDCLRPRKGNRFTATKSFAARRNKVAVARVELHNEDRSCTRQRHRYYMVIKAVKSVKHQIRVSGWTQTNTAGRILALAAYLFWVTPHISQADSLRSRR